MLYPFLTTIDKTEISYSELLHDADNQPCVRVFVERWNDKRNDFDALEVYLPSGKITKAVGFSKQEIDQNMQHILNLQDVILECAAEESAAIA